MAKKRLVPHFEKKKRRKNLDKHSTRRFKITMEKAKTYFKKIIFSKIQLALEKQHGGTQMKEKNARRRIIQKQNRTTSNITNDRC